MARSPNNINAYLEIGRKRTFAGVMEWPGWCRMGRDEAAALQALFEAGPRYFVRRLAWHVLDHVWEIEDRLTWSGPDASPSFR